MDNRWFFVGVGCVAFAIFVFFMVRSSQVRKLTIYNSFSDFNRVGEAVRTQEFIQSRLLNINFVPGMSVKILEVLKKVGDGQLDSAITSLYYWGKLDPCLYLISAMPFAYNEFQQINLINSERGQQIYDQIGKRHNVVIFPCGLTGIQVCGWWRSVPKKLQDLSGVKMRFTGMAAEIFRRLGAVPRDDIEVTQLGRALEIGDIDVAEWTTPADDMRQGFYKYAPHAMLPGWHEPGTILHFIVNSDVWSSLTTRQQQDIKNACEYSLIRLVASYHLLDGQALKELQQNGVQFHQWPLSFLREFYRIYQNLIREYSKKDALFNELYSIIAAETSAFSRYQMMQQEPLAQFINGVLSATTVK